MFSLVVASVLLVNAEQPIFFIKIRRESALCLSLAMTTLNLKWPMAAVSPMFSKGVRQISGKKKDRSMPWFIDLRVLTFCFILTRGYPFMIYQCHIVV